MSRHDPRAHDLTPELLLRAYAAGIFPMAESGDDPGVFWVDPQVRGVIPLNDFHVPRRLKKTVRGGAFEVRFDTAFTEVLELCAKSKRGRHETWINAPIKNAVEGLFELGFAHSVESWQDGELAGGLYGVSLGGAFFGESMFSRRTDASKVALVHLVAQLKAGGFILLDTQFTTEHLERFGAITIPRAMYHLRLADALKIKTGFPAVPEGMSGAQALQSITQTS